MFFFTPTDILRRKKPLLDEGECYTIFDTILEALSSKLQLAFGCSKKFVGELVVLKDSYGCCYCASYTSIVSEFLYWEAAASMYMLSLVGLVASELDLFKSTDDSSRATWNKPGCSLLFDKVYS